jgi:hypothetical protein
MRKKIASALGIMNVILFIAHTIAAVCPMNLPQASMMSRLNAGLPKHGKKL